MSLKSQKAGIRDTKQEYNDNLLLIHPHFRIIVTNLTISLLISAFLFYICGFYFSNIVKVSIKDKTCKEEDQKILCQHNPAEDFKG